MKRRFPALVLGWMLGASMLFGQTWDGGGTNANWSTKNNWNPNATPAFNSTTDLIFAGSVRTTADTNGNRTVNSITFATGASSFSLVGTNGTNSETLTFNGTGAGIGQNSANDQSILINRIRFTASATIDVSGAGNLLLGDGTATSGQLYGAGNLTKTGTGGTLVLGADNSNWSGNLQVNAGVVEARSYGNALGSTTGTTTVASGAALQLGTGGLTVGESISLDGTGVGGNGALRNVAASGTNTITSAVALGGAAQINADAGGTLNLGGGVSGSNRDLTIGGAGTVIVSGSIATGSGSLTKIDTGTLQLGAANSFTGATTVSAGTLIATASSVFGSASTLTVTSGANLQLTNTAQTIGSLAGAGAVDFGTGGTLTLAAGSGLFSGSFTGTGTLIIGAGATLTLGANFSAPGLNLILAGGTLNLNGTTSTFGTLQLTGNSVLDFGSSTASVLTVNDVTFQNSGLQLSVQNWTDLMNYFYAQNFTGATPDVPGAPPASQITFGGYSSSDTAWRSFDHQVSPVPEPRAYGVWLMLGAMGWMAWRRRRVAVLRA